MLPLILFFYYVLQPSKGILLLTFMGVVMTLILASKWKVLSLDSLIQLDLTKALLWVVSFQCAKLLYTCIPCYLESSGQHWSFLTSPCELHCEFRRSI